MTKDNRIIFSGSEDGVIKIWDRATYQEIGEMVGHTNCVNALQLTADEEFVISGGWDNLVLIWDWRNKIKVGSFDGHTKGVYVFGMSTDGNYLISGSGDFTARIWDISERKEIAKLDCDGNSVFALAITRDNKEIIVAGWGGKVRVFSMETHQRITEFTGESGGVLQSAALTKDDQYLVIGTRKNNVFVFTYSNKSLYCTFSSHTNWVRNIVASRDWFVTVSADRSIKFFNIQKKLEILSLDESEGFIFGEFLSEDEQYLITGASDRIVRIWKVGTPYRVKILSTGKQQVYCLAISPDNLHLATAGSDSVVKVWSLLENCLVGSLNGHTDKIWALEFTKDSNYILSGSDDKMVKIWDTHSFTEYANLEKHEKSVYALTSTSDSKLAISGSADKKIIVWNIQEKSLVAILDEHLNTVLTVALSFDDSLLISGSIDLNLRFWDMVNYKCTDKIKLKSPIQNIKISSDGKTFIFSDRDGNVQLWDLPLKRVIKVFTGHTKWGRSVAFTLDERIILSSNDDKTVRSWSTINQQHEGVFQGHNDMIKGLVTTSDNSYAISASEDCTIRVWDLKNRSPLEIYDYGTPTDSFEYLYNIKVKQDFTKINLNVLFGPLKVSLVHIYSYLGNEELLDKVLTLGAHIRVDEDGHSPLHYALEQGTQGCINIILEFLIKCSETNLEKFLSYSFALRNDFENLMLNRSSFLPQFLDCLFYKIPLMPSHGMPLNELPMLIYSETKNVKENEFLVDRDSEHVVYKASPIEFRTLPFPISHEIGSTGSLAILNSILNSPNKKILITEFVIVYVENKWKELWKYVFIITILLWLNILLMCALIIIGSEEDSTLEPNILNIFLAISFSLINVILFVYEGFQAYSTGISYINDFWNVVDLVRTFGCFAWVILIFLVPSSDLRYVAWIMVAFNFLRGLSGFRAFDMTRFYTKLIFKAVGDIVSFVIIFFYSTLGFGMMYYTTNDDTSPYDIWMQPYDLNMGNLDPHGFMFFIYFWYMLASVINVVIMLNLLISILGDSFDSFQAISRESSNMEMLEVIHELETMMFWNRDHDDKKYIQICKSTQAEDSGTWEGKIDAISKIIDRKLTGINNKLDILMEKK